VIVAVLDTGVDLDHPDLCGKVLTDIDIDMVNGDSSAEDDHSHGTHVAGIAAAITNNGVGVAGIGWNSAVLPVKVLDSCGGGDALTLADGIMYATNNGADVINMSLGAAIDYCPSYVQDAANYAHEQGVVLVSAGGNTSSSSDFFPANCDHVLGVAATKSDGSLASYSTSGGHINAAAPGSGIYSTILNGNYGYKSGTSMAAPFVAGLAGLLRSHYPEYTAEQIASAILDNADDMGPAGWDPGSGCGHINASRALAIGAHGPRPICTGSSAWRPDDSDRSASRIVPEIVPGEVIVSYVPGAATVHASMKNTLTSEYVPSLGTYRLSTTPGTEQDLLMLLRSDPSVAHAELNYVISIR
jgi:subtilisin family serine protease